MTWINQIKTFIGRTVRLAAPIGVLLTTLSCSSSSTGDDVRSVVISWIEKGGPRAGTAYELCRLSDGTLLGNITGSIYRLPPGEDSWEMILSGSSVGDFEEIRSDLVLAADTDGILASTDQGRSWTTQLAGELIHDIVLDDQEERILAATGSGIYSSPVDPINWEKMVDFGVQMAGVDVTSGGVLLALSRGGTVWRSTDTGDSWEIIYNEPISVPSEKIVASVDGTTILLIHRNTGSLVSYDGGANWNDFGSFGEDAVTIVDLEDGNYLGSSRDGSVWKSSDLTSWQLVYQDASKSPIYSILPEEDDGLLIGFPGSGVVRVKDGEIVGLISDGLPYAVGVADGIQRTNAGHLVVSVDGAGIWRTTDQGESWEPIVRGLMSLDVGNIERLSDGTLITGSAGGYAYRFDEENSKWIASRTPAKSAMMLPVKEGPDGKIYAFPFYGDDIYVSEQFGSGWQQLQVPAIVISLSFDPARRMYAGGRGTIYRSEDGNAWTAIESAKFNDNYVNQVQFISAESALVGLNGVGVLRSSDAGVTWQESSYGLDTDHISSLLIGEDNLLYVTSGDGFYLSYDGSLNWFKATSTDIGFRAVFEDADGSVWTSTLGHGILRGTVPPDPDAR